MKRKIKLILVAVIFTAIAHVETLNAHQGMHEKQGNQGLQGVTNMYKNTSAKPDSSKTKPDKPRAPQATGVTGQTGKWEYKGPD